VLSNKAKLETKLEYSQQHNQNEWYEKYPK